MSIETRRETLDAANVAGLVVLNPNGPAGVERIKQLSYATLSMPMVSVPGEFALTGTAAWANLVNWLFEYGAWAIIILFTAGLLAAAGVFIGMSRELGPLASSGGGRRLFWGIAAWNIGVPLSLAVIMSTIVAVGLGEMLISLSRSGSLSPSFLIVAAAAGVFTAVAVSLMCGEGAARRALSWRAVGD